MYVYVNRKIDNMMTITSQRGKINLRRGCSAPEPDAIKKGPDDTRESIGLFTHLGGIVPCRKRHHSGDLQKAYLKGVC